MSRCPTCNSYKPHLHPAVQFEGEVQPCGDDYHRTVTAENTAKRIAENDALLKRFEEHNRYVPQTADARSLP